MATRAAVATVLLLCAALCVATPPPRLHPAELVAAAVAMVDPAWPEVAVHVGADSHGLLAAALTHQGYQPYAVADPHAPAMDMGPTAASTPMAATPPAHVIEARDVVQALAWSSPAFTAVSPPTANVVLALDVAHHLPTPAGAERFVRALTAGQAHMVVFSAATPGEGAVRRPAAATPFALELQPAAWVAMFNRCGFVLATADTITFRNALLEHAEVVADAFWLPKNALVFVPAPAPASAAALRMEARRLALLTTDDGAAVRWFTLDDSKALSPLHALLVADALHYQELVQAVTVTATSAPPPPHTAATPPSRRTVTLTVPPPPAVDAAGNRTELTPDGDLLALYLGGAHDDLHAALLADLGVLSRLKSVEVQVVDRWLASFLYLMSRPDFNVVQVAHGARYLRHVELVANVVRVSHHRTTDAVLNALSSNPRAMVQMLTLYTPFNDLYIAPEQLWPARAAYADEWYTQVMRLALYGGLANAGFFRRMQRLTLAMLELGPDGPGGRADPAAVGTFWHRFEYYFTVAYIVPEAEGAVKRIMNNHFQSLPLWDEVVTPAVAALPARRHTGTRILVVCAQWKVGHSVYRNFHAYVAALQAAFDVSLLFLESVEIGLHLVDTHGFVGVSVVPANASTTVALDTMAHVRAAAYDAIFYPQLGMHACDVLFANHRLAPVQVTSYGHSSSTHGALMDYFIGGAEVEVWEPRYGAARFADRPPAQALRENPQRRYSERLVLVPGMGVVFEPLPMARPPPRPPPPPVNGSAPVVINCAWTVTKVNAAQLKVVARIIDAVQRLQPTRLHLRFFTGLGAEEVWSAAGLAADIVAALRIDDFPAGQVTVEVPPGLSYAAYLSALAAGHMALDSFPFGGCNTVMDSAFVGVPIVTQSGGLWRNRIGAAVLYRLGLDDLVTHTEEAYVNTAVGLIINKHTRQRLAAATAAADMSVLSNVTEAEVYVPLFRHLIALNGSEWRQPGATATATATAAATAADDVNGSDGGDALPADEVARREVVAEMRADAAAAEGRYHGWGLRNDYDGPLREGAPLYFPLPPDANA